MFALSFPHLELCGVRQHLDDLADQIGHTRHEPSPAFAGSFWIEMPRPEDPGSGRSPPGQPPARPLSSPRTGSSRSLVSRRPRRDSGQHPRSSLRRAFLACVIAFGQNPLEKLVPASGPIGAATTPQGIFSFAFLFSKYCVMPRRVVPVGQIRLTVSGLSTQSVEVEELRLLRLRPVRTSDALLPRPSKSPRSVSSPGTGDRHCGFFVRRRLLPPSLSPQTLCPFAPTFHFAFLLLGIHIFRRVTRVARHSRPTPGRLSSCPAFNRACL